MDTNYEQLKESLFYVHKNANDVLSVEDRQSAVSFCEGYKAFLNNAKTERESVTELQKQAQAAGFSEYDRQKKYKAGDKVYLINRNKAIYFIVFGKNDLSSGIKFTAAHIDAPRLDLKPRAVFEKSSLAFFKTHYYGGIKKYQWTAIPLSLHGVAHTKDGKKVEIIIGEDENDPVFTLTDLLPHLSAKQMDKALKDAITGEGMNILAGSTPLGDEKMIERVKLSILNIIYDKYNLTETDLITADLEIVPAFKAKDVGLDRSFVGAYGQDDRVCAYCAYKAVEQLKNPKNTTVCALVDKEEVGSEGVTGMKSKFIENLIKDLCATGNSDYRLAIANSSCLSADVSAALDPNYEDVFDNRNTTIANGGAAILKYTGTRGKAGTSEATAEFASYLTQLLSKNNVLWQTGELGKVDEGGGGTVAMYIANLNIDTIDIGVPVLSMHSPFEVTSKLDIYMTYKALLTFSNN